MAPLTQLQNFYKATLTIAIPNGTTIGNFYVSVAPTVSAGYLVLSASNSSKREIIYYNAIGSDANGPFVTVPNVGSRGMGGTTAQSHDAQESIRMNVTAQHWADLLTEILTNIPASITALAASIANKADLVINNVFQGLQTFQAKATFNVSPTVPTPSTAQDAANMAYVLSVAMGGTIASGFNAATVTYDSDGRVKTIRDNQLGKNYLISYDSDDNPVKIFDGTSTWRFTYSGDQLAFITKVN